MKLASLYRSLSLGALDSVDPREAWDHEAQDFTPWLAENLDRLATEIGFNLELEGTEVHVGSRRADIVARNPEDDSRVLIENQLEHADLHHLGQVLTRLRLRPTRHVELGLADGLNGPRPLLPLRREAAFMVARGRWWP